MMFLHNLSSFPLPLLLSEHPSTRPHSTNSAVARIFVHNLRQWTWIICTQIARSAKRAIWYLTFAWSDNCLNQDLNKVRPNECLYSWVQCFWMRKNWCLRHSQAVSHKENSTIVSHIHVLPMQHSLKVSRNKWKKEIVCTLAN